MLGSATYVCHRHRQREWDMHVMRSLSLDTSPDAFSLEASFWLPFPSLHILMPCHTSFLNLCQVPVSFLPCYNATSGILHPQSLHVSQCPSNSASLPLPSRANPPGACRGHSDLQRSRSVPLSPGPARKTESTPASDVERDSIQTLDRRQEAGAAWMFVSLLDHRG